MKKDPLETECTDSREAVALCNLMEYPKDLPPEFQNFDSIPGVKSSKDAARHGGSVNLADFCPYIQEFTWKANDVVVRGSQCQFRDNNPHPEKNFALESYGPTSRCLNHNHEMWEERSSDCRTVRALLLMLCFLVYDLRLSARMFHLWGSACFCHMAAHSMKQRVM